MLAAIALSISGCGSSPTPVTPATPTTQKPSDGVVGVMKPEVRYYKGTSSVTSPDGKTPYGPPTDDIVQRTVDPQAGTIVEDVISAGKDIPTTMHRVGTTSVFEVSDVAGTFSGKVTFEGPEWQWDSWTYAISLGNTGSLSGTGKLVAGTITTDKMFSGPDGKPSARISETLAPSTADEFASEKKRLLAMPAPQHR